jgi:hypothetical protein
VFVRIKRVNGHDYVYLVENIREGGRHLQRVIKTLGRRDQVEAAGLLDQLAISAARHTRRTLVLSAFHKGELAPLRRESIGPDLVFGRLWEQTGCGPVPRRMAAERGFAFDLERAVYASVLHRLMVSGSDRHAEAWTPHCRIPGAERLGLRRLYKAIAWLGGEAEGGRPRTELIEEALFAHRRELFGPISIAFFDTTSLWLEGQGGSLGRHGHSTATRRITGRNRAGSSSASCWTAPTGRSAPSSGPAPPSTSPGSGPWPSACAPASAPDGSAWWPTGA